MGSWIIIKVLVTGVKGQLGFDIVNLLNSQNVEAKGVDLEDFDLTDSVAVKDYVKNYSPDVIVHCAAYTAVDKAEEDKDLCYKVNVDGTQHLVDVAKELDCKFVYFSTDYVFEGNGQKEYEIDEKINPINHYGYTKYLGEKAVVDNLSKYFICRISWVFGENGNNFIKTMLRLAQTYPKLTVVSDQVGSPTYTKDVAVVVCDMIKTAKYGTYHVTNESFCSWYEFALEIFKQANIDIEVAPVPSSEYKTLATRPSNSRLSKKSLTENGFNKLPTWQDAISRYLKNIL